MSGLSEKRPNGRLLAKFEAFTWSLRTDMRGLLVLVRSCLPPSDRPGVEAAQFASVLDTSIVVDRQPYVCRGECWEWPVVRAGGTHAKANGWLMCGVGEKRTPNYCDATADLSFAISAS